MLVLSGCGKQAAAPPPKPPRIPAALAQQLATDADAVAAASGCAAHEPAVKLLNDAIAAISRVPARYREQLLGAANSLAGRIPACPPPEPKPGHEARHGHGHGHGKGHDKNKKHHGHDEND